MVKRILFVEEDANFREVFTHALREALATERLDVALIDIKLPDGNGLDLVGEINNGGPGSPIPTLVLAANLETSVAVRAVEAGARGALSKRVSVPESVDAIKRLTNAGRS